VVALAHAHAAGGEHHVARQRAGADEQRTHGRLGVGRDAEVDGLAAGLADERGERDRVRRDHRAPGVRLGGAVERDEFVARRDDRHARPAGDRDARGAHRGEQPGDAGGDARAGGDRHAAGAHVLAGGAHVAPGAAGRVVARVAVVDDEHARGVAGVGARVLDAHHRVGAVGHRGAGGDAHREAGADRPVAPRSLPCAAAYAVAATRSATGPPGARAAHVGGAHRVAVHRRVRPRRHVGRRGHVPREHAADGVGERDHLAA
jgi:hypothetical protein